MASHLAEPGVRVDELQSEAGRLVQQRPQLHAVAAAEIKRLVGAVAVVIGGPSLARAVDGVQLADQRQVIGAVLAALDVPRVQPAPIQRAVDPAAARAFSHQPRQQPRRAAVRDAAGVQRQLDRQRAARRRAAGASISARRGCSHDRGCAAFATRSGGRCFPRGRSGPRSSLAAITIAATCLQLYPTGQVHSPSSNVERPVIDRR